MLLVLPERRLLIRNMGVNVRRLSILTKKGKIRPNCNEQRLQPPTKKAETKRFRHGPGNLWFQCFNQSAVDSRNTTRGNKRPATARCHQRTEMKWVKGDASNAAELEEHIGNFRTTQINTYSGPPPEAAFAVSFSNTLVVGTMDFLLLCCSACYWFLIFVSPPQRFFCLFLYLSEAGTPTCQECWVFGPYLREHAYDPHAGSIFLHNAYICFIAFF